VPERKGTAENLLHTMMMQVCRPVLTEASRQFLNGIQILQVMSLFLQMNTAASSAIKV